MDSLSHIIVAFGSQKALAEALSVTLSAVSNWKRTGVPDAQKWRLLTIARERGLPLVAEDLGLPPLNDGPDGDPGGQRQMENAA